MKHRTETEKQVERVCDELVKDYVFESYVFDDSEVSKIPFHEFEFVAFYVAQQIVGIKDRAFFKGFLKNITDSLTKHYHDVYVSSNKAYLVNLGWTEKALQIVDVLNDNISEPSVSMSDESSSDEMKLDDDEDVDVEEEVEPMDMSDEEGELLSDEEFDETTQRGLFKKIVKLTSVDGLTPILSLSDFDNEKTLFEFFDFSAIPEAQRCVDLLLEKKRLAREKNAKSPDELRKKEFFEDFDKSFKDADRNKLLEKLALRQKQTVLTCRSNMGHGKKEQLLLFDCVLLRPMDFDIQSQKPCKDLCDFCGMRRNVSYQMRDRKSGITFLIGPLCQELAVATIDLGLELPRCNPNLPKDQRKIQFLIQRMSDANERKRTGSE